MGRAVVLQVACPSPETALALVGAARRLGVPAAAREVRGADHVQVRDADAVRALLTRLGAHDAVLAWQEQGLRPPGPRHRSPAGQLRRSQRAPLHPRRRPRHRPRAAALQILAGDAPTHLLAAGRLRLEHGQLSLDEHGQLSLDELGQRADPPLTKDAIAGRIRRLLALADHVAHTLGVPDTNQTASRPSS